MTPATIRVAYDSGWSDGDPGDGRVRFDGPRLTRARFMYLNGRCAQDTMLDAYVPTWKVGDVVIIERAGSEVNRVVAWVVGDIQHRGSYFKIPVKMRTVFGSFAADDDLTVTHHVDVVDTGDSKALVAPMPFANAAGRLELPKVPPPVVAAPVIIPEPPVAPPAATVAAPTPEPEQASVSQDEFDRLAAENAAMHQLLRELTADTTPLLVVENQ